MVVEEKPLVSVILPVYNGQDFLDTTINSVINQFYENFELLIINDGSTDSSEEVIKKYLDNSKIKYFVQDNKGVSAARNVGLKELRGDFFCFVDADDALTPNSISSRMKVMLKEDKIEFVDGFVNVMDKNLKILLQTKQPNFNGNPLKELILLKNTCYICPSWLVRINKSKLYKFQEGLTHCEDLLFYFSISEQGNYTYVEEPVLLHRRGEHVSAMNNITGMINGYINYLEKVILSRKSTFRESLILKFKILRIAVFSSLKQFRIILAIKLFIRIIFK